MIAARHAAMAGETTGAMIGATTAATAVATDRKRAPTRAPTVGVTRGALGDRRRGGMEAQARDAPVRQMPRADAASGTGAEMVAVLWSG